MSSQKYPSGSGSSASRRTLEFGRTYVVRPKGKHQATIVWLHSLGDNGSRSNGYVRLLPSDWWDCSVDFLARHVRRHYPFLVTKISISTVFNSLTNADSGFNVGESLEDSPDNWEGLDTAAAHVATLLSTEPADVKVGIGGFSMGAATALYSATCFATGKYANGYLYPINLRAVVGLSGWLPGSKSWRNRIEASNDAVRKAASLPIFICHGTNDDVVAYTYGERSSWYLSSAGFRYVTFKPYEGLGHYTIPKEMNEVCDWLSACLALEGPHHDEPVDQSGGTNGCAAHSSALKLWANGE